jgi:hypothetical protein
MNVRTGLRTIALAAATAAATMLAAPAQAMDEEVVVVKAGKVVTVSGEDIPQGEIVIIDGKVRLVGRKLEYPKGATIIDASRETVMPGMIHLRARTDFAQQRSGIRGNSKVIDDVILSDLELEPFLKNGFTEVVWIPAGTGMPGLPAILRTGGSAEEQVIGEGGYLRFTMNSQPRDKQALRESLKKAKSEIEKVDKAKQDWEAKKKEAEAKKAAEAAKPAEGTPAPAPGGPTPVPNTPTPSPQPTPPPPGPVPAPQPKPGETPKPADPAKPAEVGEFKPPDIDPTHKPLIDLLEKKSGVPGLVLEILRSSDILHAQDVLKDYEAIKPMFYLGGTPGASDYNYIMPTLTEMKPMVVMSPAMHRLPQSVSRYHAIGELMFAGVEVAYVPASDVELELENFREKAADIGRFGIDRTSTLKALTLNPAKVAGLDKRLGTIEKGKDADLVFLSGDPLDPGARVTRVMILGKVAWDAKKEVSR